MNAPSMPPTAPLDLFDLAGGVRSDPGRAGLARQIDDAWILWAAIETASLSRAHPVAQRLTLPAGEGFLGADSAAPDRMQLMASYPGPAQGGTIFAFFGDMPPQLRRTLWPEADLAAMEAVEAALESWAGDARFAPFFISWRERHPDVGSYWSFGEDGERGLGMEQFLLAEVGRRDLWAALEKHLLGQAADPAQSTGLPKRM